MLNEKILKVYEEIKKLEEIYNPYDRVTIEDVESCYTDKYVLDLWEEEKYSEETQEGWTDFESFLIDFAENNMMYE